MSVTLRSVFEWRRSNNDCRAAYNMAEAVVWLQELCTHVPMCACVRGGQVLVSLSAGRDGVVGRAGRRVLSAGRDSVVGRAGQCCRPGGTVLSAGRDGVVGRAGRCCRRSVASVVSASG